MKILLCIGILWAAVAASSAWADGLPVLGVDAGPTGVVPPAGGARYVTIPADRNTVLARVNPDGGRILGSTLLPGTFTIPAVAYDGSAGGVSANGKTLVLIQPRASFPRARTPLLVLDAKRLRVLSELKLRGDFSYDALSPDGAWLYLIQYVSATDPTRYLVRTYDLHSRRLLAKPVTDPRERGAGMRGLPITRTSSPDGRWAYTLYDGAGKAPFVHALDTATRSARCIDLGSVPSLDYNARLTLSADGSLLTVSDRGRPALAIDTRTFRVSSAAAAPASTARWIFVVLSGLGALVAAAALALAVRRRRQRLVAVQ